MPAITDNQIRDIEIVTQLVEAVPALRRYLSHHLRNDAGTLQLALYRQDWELVEHYLERLKLRLERVGL